MLTRIFARIYGKLRVIKYKVLSTCENVKGKPLLTGPLLVQGEGNIEFSKNVTIGVVTSAYFFSTYCYIEARNPSASIFIGENVYINNNAAIISENSKISIGNDTLIGTNFCALDSDFHGLAPDKRMSGEQISKPIIIKNNVLIGANVTILKGVTIGENSVIGSNSLVVKSIPSNVIAAGNPCKIIKEISS